MNKAVADARAAVFDIADGATILIGGFGLSGLPENLLSALLEKGAKDLALVSNNAGTDGHGIGLLLKQGQVKKMMMSYGGECKIFEELCIAGRLDVEWSPQGTLAERIRAGGAGIGGFFTPTGYGTAVAEGKETRQIDGRWYVLEKPIKADFAFIKAYKGDSLGNLEFRKTARNFNAVMATAAKVTIAEVEHLVEVGGLHPDHIHTPGIYVKRIFQGKRYLKPIEKRTVRPRAGVKV
ncbi:MAG: succinyl-CoA--3-ketoacid-CoA transferase [Elusimicrobia bacterium RIFCSPHIGHO2_02_FULL_61_10]|nr:MAG: succinyl-CoA--3-ketoacid-CoA transferase [Elusimicrobia bacterium RIFCSPHIGHO2_02_FULL_61_10]